MFGTQFELVLDRILNQNEYAIELKMGETNLHIENAAESLVDYVSQNIGLGKDKLIELIDNSPILGYNVSNDIIKHIGNQYDTKIAEMLTKKQLTLQFANSESLDLTQVFKYAELTNRWPICVYETGNTVLKNKIEEYFTPNQILSKQHHLVKEEKLSDYKIIYFTHWKTAPSKIKLLVSLHTLVIGHRRQQLEQLSEKVLYCTQVANQND